MPIGVFLNAIAILLGGFLGAVFGKMIPEHIRDVLPAAFGGCSMLMGVANIIKLNTMPAVVLSVILGTLIVCGPQP